MATVVVNVAKGRVVELYRRVKNADPATCAFVLVPIATAGLEADAVLIDKTDLASLVAGTTDEQVTLGRKVLVAADLAAFPAPDTVNDRYDVALPQVTWAAGGGAACSKLAICYRNATADADAAIIPLVLMDFPVTPSGIDIVLSAGAFFRAA